MSFPRNSHVCRYQPQIRVKWHRRNANINLPNIVACSFHSAGLPHGDQLRDLPRPQVPCSSSSSRWWAWPRWATLSSSSTRRAEAWTSTPWRWTTRSGWTSCRRTSRTRGVPINARCCRCYDLNWQTFRVTDTRTNFLVNLLQLSTASCRRLPEVRGVDFTM